MELYRGLHPEVVRYSEGSSLEVPLYAGKNIPEKGF